MSEPFWVEVVSADQMVWKGEATQLTAMTTGGMIGILAHHMPLLATLEAGTAEVTTTSGDREVIAVDGGFVSVTPDRTAIISPYAQVADQIDIDQARRDLRELQAKREAGDNSMPTLMAYRRALAQVKAVDR